MTNVSIHYEDEDSRNIGSLSIGTYFTISVNGNVLLKLSDTVEDKSNVFDMTEKRQYVLSKNIPVVRAFSHVDISLR